jgi:hypothetical protein
MASGRQTGPRVAAALLVAAWALPVLAEPGRRLAATRPGQGSQLVGAQSPLAGRWKADLSRSNRDPNHQFKSATLEFSVVGDTVTIAHGGVNAAGHQESGVTKLQANGTEQVLPEAPGLVIVTRWVGPRVLDTVTRQDDRTVAHGVYAVSVDGNTLTATVSGSDQTGTAFEQVIVFDRE